MSETPGILDDDLVSRCLRDLRRSADPEERTCASIAFAVDASGARHLGRTIRAAAPGLGACAVRVALGAARAEGAGEVSGVVALSADSPARLCGLCRQSLIELAPSAWLVLSDPRGVAREVRNHLPHEFRLGGTERA